MRVDKYLSPARLIGNLGKLTDSVEQVTSLLTLEQLDELVQHTRRLEAVALTRVDQLESAIAKEVRLGNARQLGKRISDARARGG